MEGYSWNQILLFFFLYCFLGWVFESVYVSVMERRLSNRGFLAGAGYSYLWLWRYDDCFCHNALSRQLCGRISLWYAGGYGL